MSDGTQSSPSSGLLDTFLKKLIAGIAGLVVLAMAAWLGIDRFIQQPAERRELAKAFSTTTIGYVEYAKKAWLDVTQRDHDDTNKSENQRHWEDKLWTQLRDLFERVERLCPYDTTRSAIQHLKCANTKYYAFYEVVEEDQPLSETVNPKRLQEDCGTTSWPLLNEDISPKSPALQTTFLKLYDALGRSRKQAVKAVNECAGL